MNSTIVNRSTLSESFGFSQPLTCIPKVMQFTKNRPGGTTILKDSVPLLRSGLIWPGDQFCPKDIKN